MSDALAITATSPSYSITIRCKIENRPGAFGRLATAIGEVGGNLGAIYLVSIRCKTLVSGAASARERPRRSRANERTAQAAARWAASAGLPASTS
jgi:hypothetical protein